MKRLFCLICAILLGIFTAVNASATLASPEDTAATDPAAEENTVLFVDEASAPDEGETMVLFGAGAPTEPVTEAATEPATEAETEAAAEDLAEQYARMGIMPLEEEVTDNRLEIMTYAALGAAGLALLLAVIALVKAGKKASNATGNYKKYF